MATKTATWEYRDRFAERFARSYFRRYADCVVSSIGVGTYLGDATDDADDRYRAALVEAMGSGINVVDTAVNYRHQRSERTVGAALADAGVDREAILVATKGGFVPFDDERPADPGAYVREQFVEPGLCEPDDVVRGNCIAPDFLGASLDRSLGNLGLETVDLYYVHNPETQLLERDREAVYDALEAAFRRLEERRAAGDLRRYGVATWEAFRVEPDHPSYLSLAEVVRRARAAAEATGNAATGFRAVQLPFNVRMADAVTVAAHEGADGRRSALRFAREADLDVFTSASIMQGELADGLPEAVAGRLAGETPVQRAINFARSGPGVTCALVGMGSPEHVAGNVAAGTFPPLGADAFDAVFE
jgi:aryl-alcohol dehydrogenase-like predicted oxidoreductase